MSRRSESCPRLARKDPAPQAQPLAPATARNCTLQDLGPEDKQKVAKLLKQVVDLGQEVQQLKQQRDELTQQCKAASEREQELQEGSQHLHKENQSLKKKLAQVLLVLRASQAKIVALEAAQQAAPQRAGCSVEVQTEPGTMGELEPQVPVVSSTPVCSGHSAPAAAQSAAGGGAEASGIVEPAALRASLSATPGGPPLLHVAPGAHINITINHAPETATAAASTAPVGAPKPLQESSASWDLAGDALLPCASGDICEGAAAVTFVPRAGGGGAASENGLAPDGSPVPTAVIAIPTTTVAAANGATGAAAASASALRAASTEVSLPELSSSISSSSLLTTAASSARPAGRSKSASVAGEAHRDAGRPAPMPKAAFPRAAAESSAGQPACRPSGQHPRNILVDATMQRFEAVPIHEVRVDSRELLTASPMIVPPSDDVVAAASSLLGWQQQAQHGCAIAAADAAGARDQRSGRKVLSFDPAIGQNGAFYFMDVADVATEPAGTGVLGVAAAAASRPVQARLLGHDGEAGGQGPGAATAAAATAAERFAGPGGPQPTAGQPFMRGGEATLRPWADGPGAGGSGHPGGFVGVPMQQQQRKLYHQHPHSLHLHYQHPVPASPTSSYASESIGAMTPFSHGVPTPSPLQLHHDTPASSNLSLSRMAVALDEVARRQRWDVQPPGGGGGIPQPPPPQQQYDPASSGQQPPQPRRGGGADAPQLAGGRAPVRQGGFGHGESAAAGAMHPGLAYGPRKYQDPHGAQGPSPQQLRHGSAGSMAAAAASMRPAAAGATPFDNGAADALPHADSLSACGSTSTWLGGNDVADRYDDSLVDILSQADEELERHHQHHHHHDHRQQYRPQPQTQRPPPPLVVPPSVAPMPTRSRAAPAATSPLSEGAQLRAKMQAASAEALLAANLYEENDVFSVILEQEGRT